MKFTKLSLVSGMMFLGVSAGSAIAQSNGAGSGFDPRDNCVTILTKEDNLTRLMLASWVYGYLNASQGEVSLVDIDNARNMVQNLNKACAAHRDASILDLVQGSKAAPASQPGSKANAQAFLEQFVQQGADLEALTAQMIPNEADVRAVFKEPLASRIISELLPRFTPGLKLGPKAGQSEVIIVHATTDELKAGKPVLRDFPGATKRILDYLNPGIPVVRFKFVKPGEKMGLAFDGLYFVNGHWALIPKVWSYLP